MATLDLNQKLLAAFQVEHIEHLEGIRSSLARLEQQGAGAVGGADLEDAFRRAHSLKGAARITGLSVVESVAHRLESLFASLRSGELRWTKEALRAIHAALDAIEDAVSALGQGRPPADPQATLQALDRVMSSGATETSVAPLPISELSRKLRAAFEEEYRDYVQGIRTLLAKAGPAGAGLSTSEVQEAFRCAHSLKGAARVAEVQPVDTLALRLESLLSFVSQGKLSLDEQVVGCVQQVLAAIEHSVAVPSTNGHPPQVSTALAGIERLLGIEPEVPVKPVEPSASVLPLIIPAPDAPAPALPRAQGETVRLSAGHLDRLLQSTGQLMTESLQQDLLTRELGSISRQIAAIEREWESVKKAAGGGLRKMAATPELARVARYVELVEHEVHALARHTRSVRSLQQRSSWSLKLLSDQLQQDVRRTRMVPAESEFQSFRKMMRDLARDEGKELEFRVTGFDVQADRMVLQALKDPLMHVLRNAVSHGIESPPQRQAHGKSPGGTVSLKIDAIGNRLTIAVEDDGRGVDLARVSEVAVRRGMLSSEEAAAAAPQELARLLFQPGFTTSQIVTELSGRGMGLSAVYETVARLQGEVSIQPRPGAGTTLLLAVPLSIATHRLLLVSCQGQVFALPLYGIEALHRVKLQEVETIEGKPMISLGGQLTALTSLAQLLNLDGADAAFEQDSLQLMVLRSGTKRVAVVVDALLMEREALIKGLGAPASQITRFAGGILLEDGTVALVINPAEIVESFRPSGRAIAITKAKAAEVKTAPTILVVDDSFTTRTLETSILETHGYTVRVAVDGIEALSRLRSDKIDLVISDIQMPRLDGFGLLEEIKKDEHLKRIPVIIVSSLERREDQERGLSLGADAYIVKRKFDHQDLLSTIRQIL